MYKETANGQWALAHKSEVISDRHNLEWKPFRVPILKEDYERRVKVRVYDYDSHSGDDEIGSFIAPMSQLKVGTEFKLKSSGKLRVEGFDVVG